MPRDGYEINYLPDSLISDLRMRTSEELSGSEMYDLERLLERAWSDGYNAGYMRGHREAWESRQRPNINEVNAVRERIQQERAAKAEAAGHG